jgi:signal transduction histidine kinase
MKNALLGLFSDARENTHVARRECARRSLPGALVFALVMVVLWFSTDYGRAFSALIAVTTVLLFALGGLRTFTSILLLRDKAPLGSFDIPERVIHFLFYASVIGSFAVWGAFSGYTAFQYVAEPKGLLVLLSSAALTAGATTSLAPHRQLAVLCVSLISLPTIGGALFRWETEFRAFALLSFVYYLFLLAQTYMNWKSFWAGHRVGELEVARLEAERLATQLSTVNAVLERKAEELSRSHHELERFTYAVSHDLQEPIRNVTLLTEVLVRKFGTNLEVGSQDLLKQISSSGVRMSMLVKDLLKYSRIVHHSGTQDLVKLDCAFSSAKEHCLASIEASSATFTSECLPTVTGNSDALVSLFQNLISNSLKYRGPQPPAIHIWAIEYPEKWEVRVQDNGIGIQPEYHRKIFELFQRLHSEAAYPGTGLGLALCERIMMDHGGSIDVESELGAGATFIMSFPRVLADALPKQSITLTL